MNRRPRQKRLTIDPAVPAANFTEISGSLNTPIRGFTVTRFPEATQREGTNAILQLRLGTGGAPITVSKEYFSWEKYDDESPVSDGLFYRWISTTGIGSGVEHVEITADL